MATIQVILRIGSSSWFHETRDGPSPLAADHIGKRCASRWICRHRPANRFKSDKLRFRI